MTLLSFDLNSTRVRAVGGQPGDYPLTVALEPPHADFPLVLSWTGRAFDAGSHGLNIYRQQPFLVYRNFLPHVGGDAPCAHRWQLGQHQLDGEQALNLVFQQLRQVCSQSRGVTFSLPPYLQSEQIKTVYQLAHDARYPLFGSIANPLALALAAHAESPWSGAVVVADIDDHALWLSVVRDGDGVAQLCKTNIYPHLGLLHWKNRLLNGLADCCIAYSRRDPRENASAEQSLYLQLDGVMENGADNRTSQVIFQTSNWHQQLMLQPATVAEFCDRFTRQVVSEIAAFFNSGDAGAPPKRILLSGQASLLPGLMQSVERFLDRWSYFHRREAPKLADSDDFGENLLDDDEKELLPRVVLLSFDAAARGAHLVAGHFNRGEIDVGHLDDSAPLPAPQTAEAGPARLHFQGREYFLRDRPFCIGNHYDCDLAFDAQRFPQISAWHCEIYYDLRKYLIKDQSHTGTWLNNQPIHHISALNAGDSIRLGPGGPELRFLGQPYPRSLSTTIA